ncbi:MAG: transglycosylase SLT domain-containing protein [Gemmatimonadetes bacterium]|nr:transglycosylase SLT domain-containing protein [Gemmatimonadota bacterium]NIO31823.1 transglycosylase SLT domain-containing protein [Gemmatimonadota bacterium]
MHLSRLYVSCLLFVVAPVALGLRGEVGDDPLAEVAEALDQGRHWYATRLLRDLNGHDSATPEAALLYARADAGRGAWDDVVARLESVSWLDSIGYGDGRALLARARLETGEPERAVEGYRIFLRYSLERTPRAVAEVGLARSLEELGRPLEAAAAYGRAAEIAPELAPWSSIRAAEVLAQLGDTAAVNELLRGAVTVPLYRRTGAAVDAHLAAGNRQAALKLLLDAAPSVGRRSTELRTRAAQLLLEEGDSAAAATTLRAAIRSSPRWAQEAASLLSQFPNLSAADHLWLARTFERSGAPGSAAREYQEYLERQQLPAGEWQAIQLRIGELLFRAGRYYAAVDELERLAAAGPSAATLARAEYYIARATYRRGWRREGRARLREVADRFPGAGSALNALSLLGDLYEGAGNTPRAVAIYEELVRDYSGSRAERTARYRLGILAYREGDFADARRHFDRLRRAERSGDLRISATYWAARARLAEGDAAQLAEAERLFREVHNRAPFGYYGFLAADRLGIDPWAALAPGPEPAPIDAETERKLRVIDLLSQAGLHEEAKAVLGTITSSPPQSPEALIGISVALAEHGFGQQAVLFGWRAHSALRGRWSANVLRAIYPLAYQEIILAEADSRKLDPHLVAAIARQESAFAPDVTSRAGARGLLQIMPETGRWWANRLGVRDYSDELLYHPEINVHLGAAYFADLQRRYAELQLSLIAYNAGPTRARRWRQRPEYRIDPELFAERIPFSETRTYVKNVQSHFRIYSQLYSGFGGVQPAE